MSSVAVFLVLAGGTAFAAAKLGKNTVGTKQLKNNAVTAAKIKNGAVSGAKLNLKTLGTVPSANTANSAATANSANTAKTADTAKTAESAKTADTANTAKTASTANTANTANSANTANTANTAANANAVGGNTLRKVFYVANAGEGPTEILNVGGLVLTATCAAGAPEIIATTSTDGSIIHTSGSESGTTFYQEDDEFDTGTNFAPFGTATDSVIGDIVYAQPNGTVVTVSLLAEEEGLTGGNTDCVVTGQAIAG